MQFLASKAGIRGSINGINQGADSMSVTNLSFTSSPRSPSRREFGKAVASAALGTLAAPMIVRGRNLNDKLNIAMIGVGRRGAHNLKQVGSENIVALCDVSEPLLD